MIPVQEALDIVSKNLRILESEVVELDDSIGRVLAADISADTDMPPFDRSQMDGFAVRSADISEAPVTLYVVGESAAGRGWSGELMAGQAVRIMTGARVPLGANAVQKLELAAENGSNVTIEESVVVGRNIVPKGAEIKKGETVFRRGERIRANMVAPLAAFGYDRVRVARKPKVSILSTGTEIVDIDQVPGADQIRNSNSAMLASLSKAAGANVSVRPRIGDDLERLKSSISAAEGSDVLVITGGVSVGKYDLTKAALRELGTEIYFERVRLRPGKPMVFGKLGNTFVFGIPGNPVSAAVTFYLFVRKAILQMQNSNHSDLMTGSCVLTRTVRAAAERETYLPAILKSGKEGLLFAEPVKFGGSSDFVGFSKATALLKLNRGDILDEGDVGEFLWIE